MQAKILFTLTCLFTFLFAGAQDWQPKIDPTVWQAATAGQDVEFLVLLAEQADVSEAAFFIKKEEKGGYVFRQLSELAVRTQVNVLKTIADFDAPHRSFWIVNSVWAEGGAALLEELAKLPEVAEIHSNPSVPLNGPVRDNSVHDRAVEWGLTNINAPAVWAMGYKGAGVVVSGQDTGYEWDVPALKLKYRGWDNSSMTADHNYNWHDAIHSNAGANSCGFNSAVPCDDHNHGTHTMGTMVGLDGANEIGVAPDAKWIGCRNMDVGNGTPATYIECFEWLLAPTDLNDMNPDTSKAPHVINNSWSCPTSEGCNSGNWADMETAINNLRAAGVVVVVSAGNSGSTCSTVNAPPAIFAGSFDVGASNSSNAIAGFSSRGPVTVDGSNRMKPDVSAPGVSVRSCIRGGNYDTFSGTSMAGPHVAGTVALLISANPSLAGNVAQIEDLLKSTAGGQTTTDGCGGDGPTSSPNNTYGRGIINAEAAVNAALALLPVELIRFTGKLTASGVQLNWETALPGSLHHFEIERSKDGRAWGGIGKKVFLPTSGDYGLLDEKPLPGNNYYRLKMVDLDGSFEYSKVVVVQLKEKGGISIFPNPAFEKLSLFANWQPGGETVFVFSASGQLLLKKEVPATEKQQVLRLDVAALPPGVYFIKTVSGDGALLQDRFLKM
ncbi:MAG TPA: T9SS type A sorting domain-containing protein [Bacteroidetes bacterium]|nr:T9SS type A sorting domain-containing protein [Bacteroidota bacterium]